MIVDKSAGPRWMAAAMIPTLARLAQAEFRRLQDWTIVKEFAAG
jgi:hypothetical protein